MSSNVNITKGDFPPVGAAQDDLFIDQKTGSIYYFNGSIFAPITALPTFGATASTSAVGDAASGGVAATASRGDHLHGREGFGAVVAVAANDASATGAALTVAHSDHNHGLPANVTPVTQAFADAAAVGVSSSVARADHKHGMPASPFVPTVIGPTFLTAGDVTMTSINTWYTGITLASALVAGGVYLISGTVSVTTTDLDAVTFRLFDSTNSVVIAEGEISAGSGRLCWTASAPYSGFAGTPTIVIQANNATSAGKLIKATAVENGDANKATQVGAVRLS